MQTLRPLTRAAAFYVTFKIQTGQGGGLDSKLISISTLKYEFASCYTLNYATPPYSFYSSFII